LGKYVEVPREAKSTSQQLNPKLLTSNGTSKTPLLMAPANSESLMVWKKWLRIDSDRT